MGANSDVVEFDSDELETWIGRPEEEDGERESKEKENEEEAPVETAVALVAVMAAKEGIVR